MAMTTKTASLPELAAKPRRKKEWAPRIWEGCSFFAWLRLLVRNRFAVNWRYSYIAVIVTLVSFLHSVLKMVQSLVYGRRIRRTEIREDPIFIIGHWRTGTTYLHELLVRDSHHTYPNYYECMEPNHFLLTEWFITRWLRFLMPSRRPMDNMAIGWDRPQEDEFALCMMGQPSPYLTIGFPNRPQQYPEYLDLEGISARAVAQWKQALLDFLKRLTFKNPRRLVLKSPPHTCRIKVLLEMFPNAKFVHIVRDPYVLFPSTIHLWKSLYQTHGLQVPKFAGLEEFVFATFTRMYDKLEETRHLIPAGNFHEVRYEELTRDPVGQMRALYEHLDLGRFEDYLPALRVYLENTKNYETNRYELTPELKSKITRKWGKVIRHFGYAIEPDAPQKLQPPHIFQFPIPRELPGAKVAQAN